MNKKYNIIRDDMQRLEKITEMCDPSVAMQVILLKNEIDLALIDKEIDSNTHSRLSDELSNQARYYNHYCKCTSLR